MLCDRGKLTIDCLRCLQSPYMVSEQLPIACRYVPYDQWFITHIDPDWKVQHLKQRILAKCLNLPFDPRFIQKDATSNARSPSPITFAPDTSSSPIDWASDQERSAGAGAGAADEGYEEDDEGEQDPDPVGTKIKVKSKSFSPTTISPSYPRLQQQKQDQEPQIITHTYTLFRFSTCQILEEQHQITWYDIQPHELVELHPSFPPLTFTSSVIPPMSIPSPPPHVTSFPQTKSTQKKKKKSSTSTHQPVPLILSLTDLPRHIPSLYIQPYWQGWVRSLRVVWRIQMVPTGDGSPSDNADRRGRRLGESVEWREKWLVIHDGIVNICKNPTDSNPTRFPLSSLVALRGPEYLSHSFKKGTSNPQSNPTDPSTTTGSLRSTSYYTLAPSATSSDLLKQTDSTDKDPKRNTRNLKKPRKEGLFSAASSPSLRSLGQDRQPQRTSSYTPTFKSKSVLPLTAEDHAREKILEKRQSREKVEREVESLKKWDDIGFSFTLGGKDKSKSKGKEKDKEEDIRDRELRRVLLVPAPHSTSHHREGSDKDHSRSKSVRDKDKIIPTSREEADQAGMKIICINFRVQPSATGERDKVVGQDDVSSPKTRKYTSTGPSLALVAASATGGTKMKKTSTAPHVVIGPDVYVGEAPFENFHGSPTSHSAGFNRNLLGGVRDKGKEKIDNKEHEKTEKRKFVDDDSALSSPLSAGAAEDCEFPAVVNPLGWKRADTGGRSTGIGDEEGYAGPSAPSSPTITRPTVVIPILTPATAAIASVSPESQPENQTMDNPDSDSSSSISISSPVFAHSPHGSDLDDEILYGTASSTNAGSSTNRPRKGYRYGGYHTQAQMKKVSEMEDERFDSPGPGKVGELEMESKSGDGSQSQQARGPNRDEDREGWITLDMVTDHAFNSILRILHRHSPPSLSSSFTHSHTAMDSPISSNISNISTLDPSEDIHDGHKDQTVPLDTDDNSQHVTPPATRSKAIHPPILEYLSARAAANHSDRKPLCVALPYPEWRLEVVNRARRAGMREIGRPLDLALHGWGREFEEMATAARERKLERERELEREKKKRRRSVQSHVSTIKARNRKFSKVAGGSEADDDDDGSEDEEAVMGETRLDSDSEEESDTEWLAWMTDLPRQFLVQQQSQSALRNSQAFSIDPMSSSSLVDSGPVRLPRTQEEERILYANKMRQLEPSAVSSVTQPYLLPSPTSNSFMDSLKQLPALSSSTNSSLDSLNQHHQRGSSSTRTPTPSHVSSSMDDLFLNQSRSQSRSLQHLASHHRNVGSVAEEGANPVAAAASSSSRHELHHSVSMDQQHLSSRKMEVDSSQQQQQQQQQQQHFSMVSTTTREESVLGKPILTPKQITQIETASNWPPILMPLLPSPGSHTPSASISTLTPQPPVFPAPSASGEAKAPSSSINRFTPSDLTRWPRSFGASLSTPSSPSASVTVTPNSTSPPRSSVFGSLGRSPSLLGKMGGQEKERKGFLKKRMSRDLGKDREREGESGATSTSAAAAASPKQRPKLLLSGLSSSSTTTTISPFSQMSSMPLENLPEISSPTAVAAHSNNNPISSSARALLRRVRSGSSLRDEESSSTPTPTPTPAGMGVVSPETEASKGVQKKKKGPIDRIVRGFDSSLAFAEGR